MLFAGLTVAAFLLVQAALPPLQRWPPRPVTVSSSEPGPRKPPPMVPSLGRAGSPPSSAATARYGRATERY